MHVRRCGMLFRNCMTCSNLRKDGVMRGESYQDGALLLDARIF